jgi:hypothetical protein
MGCKTRKSYRFITKDGAKPLSEMGPFTQGRTDAPEREIRPAGSNKSGRGKTSPQQLVTGCKPLLQLPFCPTEASWAPANFEPTPGNDFPA